MIKGDLICLPVSTPELTHRQKNMGANTPDTELPFMNV